MQANFTRKLEFRSRGIAAFSIGFGLVFAVTCLVLTLEARSLQRRLLLNADVGSVFERIEGGPLKMAQLHAADMADEFLHFQFDALNKQSGDRFLSAEILGGKEGNESYGRWVSAKAVPSTCVKRNVKEVRPADAFYPFTIVVMVDACAESSASQSVGHAIIWLPLALSAILMIGLGAILFTMLRAVRQADEVISQTDDPRLALTLAGRIRWKNVQDMLRRAIETKGKNLQFFHTLLKDAEHDLSSIIRSFRTKITEPQAIKQLDAMQMIMRRLNVELSQPAVSDFDNHSLEVAVTRFVRMVTDLLPGARIAAPLTIASNLSVIVSDKTLVDRLLLNLNANAERHGKGTPFVRISIEEKTIKVIVQNSLTMRSRLKLLLAFRTGRVDTGNSNAPVLSLFFGREGRGLTIAKQSALRLGAEFIFRLNGKTIESGFAIPLTRSSSTCSLEPIDVKRFAYFESEELISLAQEQGLSAFLVSRDELNTAISKYPNCEIASDVELHLPREIKFKSVERRERLLGLAQIWGTV